MLILSRVMTVIHPLILRTVIVNITCQDDVANNGAQKKCAGASDTYILIIFYACLKFLAEVVNYLREIPFSYVSANAEKHIAKTVHSHM